MCRFGTFTCGFLPITGTILRVPIIRKIIVFGGLYWGSPSYGNYHMAGCSPTESSIFAQSGTTGVACGQLACRAARGAARKWLQDVTGVDCMLWDLGSYEHFGAL